MAALNNKQSPVPGPGPPPDPVLSICMVMVNRAEGKCSRKFPLSTTGEKESSENEVV